MSFLKRFRHKPKMAKIDSSIALKLVCKKTFGAHEMLSAIQQWQNQLGTEERETMLFNTMDSKPTKFIGYFSPYTLECFIRMYKNLINQEINVPDTGGRTYHPVHVDLSIIENTFKPKKWVKDKRGVRHLALDSSETLEAYPAGGIPLISDDFVNILYSLYRIIFYYKYTPDMLTHQLDPQKEFTKTTGLAKAVRAVYASQHRLEKGQIPTTPSYQEFEAQDLKGVTIPDLTMSSEAPQKESEARQSASKSAEASASASAESASRQSASMQESARESASASASIEASVARAKSSESASMRHSASKDSSTNLSAMAKSMFGSSEQSSQPSAEPSSVSSSSSEAKSEAPASVSEPKPSAAAKPKPSQSAELVNAREFAKQKFPMTSKPSVVSGAIQLLMDRDPNIFQPSLHLQRFHVEAQPTPVPPQEALRTGKLDNQHYVVEMDNQFRQTANEIIDGRAKDLNLSYTRMLINLVYGAYSKIDAKILKLLKNESRIDKAKQSAQRYYNDHFDKINAKLNHDQKIELDSVNKSLLYSYKSKKSRMDSKIIARYSRNRNEAGAKLNRLTNTVLANARWERNRELDDRINRLREDYLRKIRLQIKNHEIEYKHKVSEAGEKLFSFLNRRLQTQHSKAIAIASRLVKEQVKRSEAKANLKQAQNEAVKSNNDRQANAHWAKSIQKMRAYIRQRDSQISEYESRLTQLQADSQSDKNRLNEALINNRTLKDSLNNTKADLKRNQEEIAENRGNLAKYQQAEERARAQQEKLAQQSADFQAQSQIASQKSSQAYASASQSASLSASQRLEEERQHAQERHTKLTNKMFSLSRALQSAKATENVSSSRINTLSGTVKAVKDAYKSRQASLISSADQNRLSMQASSGLVSQASSASASTESAYQKSMAEVRSKLKAIRKASKKADDAKRTLADSLASVQKSMASYKLSLSASASVSYSAVESRDASVNSSIASQDRDYQDQLAEYKQAMASASSTNQNTTDVSQSIASMKAKMASYDSQISRDNKKRDAQAKATRAKQAKKDKAYRAKITSLKRAVRKASGASKPPVSAEDELAKVRASYQSEYAKASAEESVRDKQYKQRADVVAANYQNKINSLALDKKSLAAEQASASSADNSDGSKSAEAKVQAYANKNASLKKRLDSYKSSVSASAADEASAVKASNSAASSITASPAPHASAHNPQPAPVTPQYNFQPYNPLNDQMEKRRLEHEQHVKSKMAKLEKMARTKNAKPHKKKHWWEH